MTDEQGQSGESGRILVVDDNAENLHLIVSILNMRGYDVYQAVDGQSALRAARSTPLDLILLDIQMPDLNGYQVCEYLKADDTTAHIPIIFISASHNIDGIIRAFDAGGVDYITKPFEYREVLARVASQMTLVHQRQQIERLREQDRQNFEALDRMKAEFFSMATHDLRSPLNIIQGYIALLEEVEVSERDAELLQQALHDMQASVRKMMTLVSDMLDLAQLESGVAVFAQETSFREFLDLAVSSADILAAQQNLGFSYHPPAEDAVVELDRERMSRVIDNLISNALKYTPEGGQVQVVGDVAPNYVSIHVIDTGLGIPAEDIPHLFDTFFRVQARSHRQIEGTGLGLSIVKAIVEQHGGSIAVSSEYGQGSEFSVRLPRA